MTSPTFSRSVSGLNAYAEVTSSTGMMMTCGVTYTVLGFVANKNASLARTDGGAFNDQSKDNVYQADTLLSWDDSDGVIPGPTTQTLTGVYGGTWTKFNGGADDNVNVTWSGAFYVGAPVNGEGYAPPGNHHTTTYPATTGGKMPMADSSLSKKTQEWTYQVRDNGDATQLNLTCRWICHYAIENFRETLTGSGNPMVLRTAQSSRYVTTLSFSYPSATFNVPDGGLSALTDYVPQTSPAIPGITLAPKHIAIANLRARIGQVKAYNWMSYDLNVSYNQSYGPGEYGIKYVMVWPGHVGRVDAWNKKGQSQDQGFEYFLDNEAQFSPVSIHPDGTI